MGTRPATESELIGAIREVVRLGPISLDATLTLDEGMILGRASDLLLPVQTNVAAYTHLEAVVDAVRSDTAEEAERIMTSALAFANLHR